MTMNLGSHIVSHWEMFKHLVDGDEESADATRDFYDEYRSVCDMDAAFYLQTVDVVFQRHLLPKGEMSTAAARSIRRRSAIRRCWRSRASATIFRGIGQTKAALDIATRLPAAKKKYLHGQGRRPLRHLQRPQMAREDRSGRREMDRGERLDRSLKPVHPQPVRIAEPCAVERRLGAPPHRSRRPSARSAEARP